MSANDGKILVRWLHVNDLLSNIPYFIDIYYRVSLATTQRRMFSASGVPQPSLTKTWLSDPSTYPIIGVVGCALCGCTSFMTYKITNDKAVRITSATKGKVIRTW